MIYDADIIVIGAGAAGLMAASELSKMGWNVLILEARDRIGGRIHTIHEGNQVFEAGAEFIHGELPQTMNLLREGAIKYHQSGGRMERSNQGEWIKQGASSHGWGDLMKKMEEMKEDMVVNDFLNVHFSGEQYAELRQTVRGLAEGFDLADISRASTRALYKEWSNEEDNQFRIDSGFDQLVNLLLSKSLSNGCRLSLSHIVHQVKWSKEFAQVYVGKGKTFQAKKVLITIPLGLLQNENKIGSIRFEPSLGHFQDLFKNIGYGSVMKVLLRFSRPFWEEKMKNLGFILSDQAIPTWWTQAPMNSNLLTGWLAGHLNKFENFKDSHFLEVSLDSLGTIFSIPAKSLKKQLSSFHIVNWNEDPFSMGGYSYWTPETAKALKQLNEPLSGTIYFGGEALYEGDAPGTVEAALQNGLDLAKKIEQYLRN